MAATRGVRILRRCGVPAVDNAVPGTFVAVGTRSYCEQMTEQSSSQEQADAQGSGQWRGPNSTQTPVNVPEDGDAATPDEVVNTGQQGDPTAEKDPDDWVTGDEPATGAQVSYLQTLARRVGRDVPDRLSKADASRLIDELQAASK